MRIIAFITGPAPMRDIVVHDAPLSFPAPTCPLAFRTKSAPEVAVPAATA